MSAPVVRSSLFHLRGPALVACLACAAGCAEPSPEEQVRALLARGERAAEERDLATLSQLVSQDYGDADGRDRTRLLAEVRGFLAHRGSIHLLTRVRSLRLTSPERAEVTILIAAAAVPISDLPDLGTTSADFVRSDLVLVREKEGWRLLRASRDPARLGDFLGR